MSSPTDACEQQSIESRLERLETQSATLLRQNRRLKQALLGIVLLCGTGLLMGGRNLEVAKVVEAEKFILRDSEGRQRASIRMSGESPVFVMADAKGDLRFMLESSPTQVMFALYDSKGKSRIGVGVKDESGPQIRLQDESEATRMLLSTLGQLGDPVLIMGDGKEQHDAVLLGHTRARGISRLRFKEGSAEFEARVTRDGPMAVFKDNKGTDRMILSALTIGTHLLLRNDKGKERAVLSVLDVGGTGFMLLDDKDRVLFSKP